MTDLSPQDVDRFLITEGMRNVSYDAHHNVVFVENRLNYMIGGRKDLVAKSIMSDYWANSKAKMLWRKFTDKYKTYIRDNVILHEFFNTKVDLRETEEQAYPLFLGATPLTPYADDVETEGEKDREIQDLLNRYSMNLPADDVERIFRVYDHVSSNRRTRRPLSTKKRLSILRKLDREPVELVARAAYVFTKSNGISENKNLLYFMNIVGGGARTWYNEFASERRRLEDKDNGNR